MEHKIEFLGIKRHVFTLSMEDLKTAVVNHVESERTLNTSFGWKDFACKEIRFEDLDGEPLVIKCFVTLEKEEKTTNG